MSIKDKHPDADRDIKKVAKRRNLPQLLLQAREATIAQFRPILNAHGLTEQQWRVIRALLDKGPLEPRQISEASQISSPSMAGVLARMDDMGLVQRDRMAHDKRRVVVKLTTKSRALARKMTPKIEAVYQAMERKLSPELVARLHDTVDQLIEQLANANEPQFEAEQINTT